MKDIPQCDVVFAKEREAGLIGWSRHLVEDTGDEFACEMHSASSGDWRLSAATASPMIRNCRSTAERFSSDWR
jgi:hypothetical protein